MAKTAIRNQSSTNTDANRKRRKHHENNNNNSHHPVEVKQDKEIPKNGESESVFPRFTPFVVFAITLVLRVFYVIDPTNWWMVHPDEVYQSIEVAHIELYGYGFRAYDFSPPETPSVDVTRYRQMELQANMYALRSPLFPYFYVFVGWMAALGGIQVNPYVLWRVAHVIISSLLPLTVCRYVSSLYGSTDKGCVAAILVASSTHLNVFGTHCLLTSFLPPITFLALSMLIDSSDYDKAFRLANDHEKIVHPNVKVASAVNFSDCETLEDLHNNNNTTTVTNSWSTESNNRLKEIKRNGSTEKAKSLNSVHNQHNGQDTKVRNTKDCQHLPRNNLATRPTQKTSHIYTFMATCIATLTCYIRPDVTLVYIVNVAAYPQFRQILRPGNLIALILGASGAIVIGLGTDFSYYGWGVSSCINWVSFNVLFGYSTLIFGHMSYWLYIEKFFYYNFGITMLSIFSTLVLFLLFWKIQNKDKSSETKGIKLSPALQLINSLKSLSVWLVLFLAYSLNGHKELRFIHDVIALFLVFIADVLVNLKYIIQSQGMYKNCIRLILVVFTVTQWRSFPGRSNNMEWVYQKTEDVQDVNLCIKYISEQTDVTGVFYDANLYMTGGMSLSHHDVTIMSRVEGGFYEFGLESRKNYTRKIESIIPCTDKNQQSAYLTKSINEFTRASNYIVLANAQAAVRVIIQKPVYNYLVLRRDRRFLDVGFKEVFVTERSRVLRRSSDKESEYVLQGLLERISMGNNATVLLHEGDVLLNMNQYQEASARFYRAITLDEKLVEAYLPLQICYSKLGNERAARAVRGKCLSLFDEVACSTSRKITRV